MSRLIVKNLPNKANVEKLKQIFSDKGEVTDVQLKYTKDGKFRNFGFVGYRTEQQASEAKEHFDGSFINSSKISVQVCANLGDEKKPKAWSKYATDSTAYKKLHPNEIPENDNPKKNKFSKSERTKNKIKELLQKHKNDPLFLEFIEAHVNDKTAWIREALEETNKNDDSGMEDEEPDEEIEQHNEAEPKSNKQQNKINHKVANTGISDLEYMKLLMKKVDGVKDEKVIKAETEVKPKKVRNRPLFYVKITGLPYKCKKKDIKGFFKPLVPFSIRFPLGKGKKITGFCYVGFRTEKELNKAIAKDKLFIGNHRLHVHKYEDKAKKAAEEEELTNNIKNRERDNNGESIGESGSIFVRNLAYVVAEEELTNLFEKYGPLAEVNMPIDPILRQPKGFATVTFVMPEHAVKAYTELDGTAFCGRMLHLLPAKTERLEDDDNEDGLTFKEKKAKKLKQQAKSSHNWNVLFLGSNAVADVVAANYSTSKEQLLSDNNKNTTAAVRLALGETQLVAETKTFLESNGVFLDAFNKPPQKRSKTCLLVKNLPAGTDKSEIKVLFEKHGQLARFLMPNHGITAIVDFIEPFEAKKAFSKLAYSQFKSSPLYLEWAPENVFAKSKIKKNVLAKTQEHTKEDMEYDAMKKEEVHQEIELVPEEKEIKQAKSNVRKEEEYIEEEQPENDTTLFVKNINFKTTEESLRTHFADCGRIHSVSIAKKKDPRNPGNMLSMGYGFVQFVKKQHANEALKELQSTTLDGKTLELKRSERGNTTNVKSSKKSSKNTVQNGTKILVRNVPFQANRNELHEIFRAFGDIKTLRLPKRLAAGSDQHRGFAFIDYYSKADAKSAFEALCQSTHLYGRHMVLEWADQSDENEDIGLLRKRTAEAFNMKVPGGKKSRKGAVDVETFVEPDN